MGGRITVTGLGSSEMSMCMTRLRTGLAKWVLARNQYTRPPTDNY